MLVPIFLTELRLISVNYMELKSNFTILLESAYLKVKAAQNLFY
jgi:hypothetical protein